MSFVFTLLTLKVWDSSGFSAAATGPPSGDIAELCIWRGHKKGVTSLDWVELQDKGARNQFS